MKKQLILGVALALATITNITAYAGNWENVGNNWKYKEDNGTYAASGWQWIDGKSYYFNADGIMAQNTVIDGYTVNADGQWTVNGVVQTQGGTGQTTNGVNHSENYDPAHPLATMIDEWNLRLTPETNFTNYYYLCDNDNVHAMLTGQMEYYHERTGWLEYLNETEQELYQWFCGWLNSMDFEHLTEMERAQAIKSVLAPKQYNFEPGERNSYYSVLIDGKAYCSEFALTAMSLAKALGLKAAINGSGNHASYYIQADNEVYQGDNAYFNLSKTSSFIPSIWVN